MLAPPIESQPPRLPKIRKRPIWLFFIAGFWFLTGVSALFIGIVSNLIAYEVIGILTLFLVTALINGWRWSFWFSAILVAMNVGMRLLQMQIAGWRFGESGLMVQLSFGFSLFMLLLHQVPAVLSWFEIQPTKKNQVTVFLTSAVATLAGQYLLPTLRSLSQQ